MCVALYAQQSLCKIGLPFHQRNKEARSTVPADLLLQPHGARYTTYLAFHFLAKYHQTDALFTMAFALCHVQLRYDITMNPIITKADHNTIKSLIANLPDHLKTAEIRQLTNELNRAQVVANDKIPKDVIQLNSYFEIEEINSKQQINFTVTLPNKANIAEKRVSILSPLGIALIGFRKGMTVQWTLPGGPKKLKILKVEQAIEEAKIQTL